MAEVMQLLQSGSHLLKLQPAMLCIVGINWALQTLQCYLLNIKVYIRQKYWCAPCRNPPKSLFLLSALRGLALVINKIAYPSCHLLMHSQAIVIELWCLFCAWPQVIAALAKRFFQEHWCETELAAGRAAVLCHSHLELRGCWVDESTWGALTTCG